MIFFFVKLLFWSSSFFFVSIWSLFS